MGDAPAYPCNQLLFSRTEADTQVNMPLSSPRSRSRSRSISMEKKVFVAAGRFSLSHRIGSGSFGDIYEGKDLITNTRIAVKLEKKRNRCPQLEYESRVYRMLHQTQINFHDLFPVPKAFNTPKTLESSMSSGTIVQRRPFSPIGIPKIHYYGAEGEFNLMVLELCGPSLEDLLNYCHRRFSLKTVLMIAEQMLHRIQFLHERGFVHRDIKPENFTFGMEKKSHVLYIIDFGLSKLYWDHRKNVHIPFQENKPLTGTARYCSINTHRGYEQSRRDDLESIGILLIYFMKGSLPWQGIQAKDQHYKTIKIGEKKITTSLEELCQGLPKEFLIYLQYCRNLSFQQKPDYDYLRILFRFLAQQLEYICKPSCRTSIPAPPAKEVRTSQIARSKSREKDLATEDQCFILCQAQNPLASQLVSSTQQNFSGPPSEITQCSASAKSRRQVIQRRLLTKATNPEDLLMFHTIEPDAIQGYYDWMFDWFIKRSKEVKEGLRALQTRKESIVQAPVNPIIFSDINLTKNAVPDTLVVSQEVKTTEKTQ